MLTTLILILFLSFLSFLAYPLHCDIICVLFLCAEYMCEVYVIRCGKKKNHI